jgi:hypothetical protein
MTREETDISILFFADASASVPAPECACNWLTVFSFFSVRFRLHAAPQLGMVALSRVVNGGGAKQKICIRRWATFSTVLNGERKSVQDSPRLSKGLNYVGITITLRI